MTEQRYTAILRTTEVLTLIKLTGRITDDNRQIKVDATRIGGMAWRVYVTLSPFEPGVMVSLMKDEEGVVLQEFNPYGEPVSLQDLVNRYRLRLQQG